MIITRKSAAGVYAKSINTTIGGITQDEKDDLDTLLATHQVDAPDFVSLLFVKIVDTEKEKRILAIVYKNSSDAKSKHVVNL